MLKEFITTQKAFNKSVEEKLDKLDSLSLKVDNIAHDVEMLKIRISPLEERKTTLMNAIQVQINENIRMLAKLKDRWARERKRKIELRAFLHTPLLLPSKLLRISKLLVPITSLVHLMDPLMVMLIPQP